MARPQPLSDLMALATIRRILLELGHEPQPEDAGAAIGQIERWMHEPRPELDGLSALAALQTANGEVRLRKVLQSMLTRY